MCNLCITYINYVRLFILNKVVMLNGRTRLGSSRYEAEWPKKRQVLSTLL